MFITFVAYFQKSYLGNRIVKLMKIALRQRQKGKEISLYLASKYIPKEYHVALREAIYGFVAT
jgi:hypothetical protein